MMLFKTDAKRIADEKRIKALNLTEKMLDDFLRMNDTIKSR